MSRIAQPSLDDSLAAAASEGIGGPIGDRAHPHPWWKPVRVVLAVACLAFVIGMVQKAPCVSADWAGGDLRYAKMCYSDVPYLYTGRGFAERSVPFSDTEGRWPVMEYPVVIGYFAYGATLVTHALSGWPDVEDRIDLAPGDVYRSPGVVEESGLYFIVTGVLLGGFALLASFFMAGAHRSRPWDAMLFAASPALILTGLVNWDLLAVAMVAGAMWAWARGKTVLSGIFIGLGIATKLYPLFLLGALLIVCLRTRQLRPFLVATGATVVTWALVNAPAMMYGFDQWTAFWSFNSERGADLGSLWLVWQQAGYTISPDVINLVSWVFFIGICLSVFALGMLARRTPRIAQLAFLIVAGFLIVNKVYSPQYVLWLLPLAVLARPRWRDILIWQAGEVFYFAAVWLYLGEFTASGASGQPDRFYWLAIAVRILAELYLMTVVVRDIVAPWRDPVRADGLTEDPMHPDPVPSAVPRPRPRLRTHQ